MPEAREFKWTSIGGRIREARDKMGLTQQQLGTLVGVSSQTVWSWEAGRVKPTHDHLEDLAYRCEMSTAWLLGRSVLEADLLKEANVSFHDAVEGLPLEDVETIQSFIRFVRQERRRRTEVEG